MTLPPALVDAALDALALLIPVSCAGCGAVDRSLCASCQLALTPRPSLRALRPGAVGSAPVVAGLRYEGVARAVILAFKDGERPGLASPLAPAVAAAAAVLQREVGPIAEGTSLCPVPSSGAARRGYRPVERLARAAGLRLEPLLAIRPGAIQKQLTEFEREQNAWRRLRLARPVAGRHVILVDDVVTTGASLRAASSRLEEGGARVIGALALASTPRRSAPGNSLTSSQEFTR